MRVRLKGIHTAIVKRADGAKRTYHYAWRGGPRLVGKPGSPEYVTSYYAAHQTRREPTRSIFHSIIAGYKASQDFQKLEPRTQRDYLRQIARIEIDFGDLPLAALDDPRVTRDFLDGAMPWRTARGKPTTHGWFSCGSCRGLARAA